MRGEKRCAVAVRYDNTEVKNAETRMNKGFALGCTVVFSFALELDICRGEFQ